MTPYWQIRIGAIVLTLCAILALVFYARHEHNRAEGEKVRADQEAAQAKANTATTQASDKTASDVRVIYKEGATEVIHVQSLPGAQNQTDDVRRRELCDALNRVYHGTTRCDAQSDGQPAGAVPSP